MAASLRARRLGRWAKAVAPWGVLAIFLAWGWRGVDLVRTIPAGGDALEIMWAISWYDEALRSGADPATYPLAFHPGGWQLATFGQSVGPALFIALVPLARIAGPAFSFHIAELATFVAAFTGMFLLARRFTGRFAATVAATLFTFWGLRWFQTIGHLNFLLGSACLPWVVWALERGCSAHIRGRRIAWFMLAGAVWAGAIAGTLYFAWIGGILVGLWLLGRQLAGTITWRITLAGLTLAGGCALLLSAPGLYSYLRASGEIGAGSFSLDEVHYWGASLNELPLPFLFHPWLGALAVRVYRGVAYEQGVANLGFVTMVAALGGWLAARWERRWLPVALVTAAGLILCLGLTLKWDNEPVRWPALRGLDALIWRVGQALKPGTFLTEQPREGFDAVVPLPGMVLSALVPLFERARVFARYAFLAGLGVFLLAGLAVERLRGAWPGHPRAGLALSWVLAGALLFEVVPPPLGGVPFPPATHPAFEWLKAQDLQRGQAVADVKAASPYLLVLDNGGATVWATQLHGKPAVAGASSVWPAYTKFLNDWLGTHPHAFLDPQTVPLLRSYGTRYVLLHMASDLEPGILKEAVGNPEIRLRECFPQPSGGASAWPYPICVLELLPRLNPAINVVLGEGWSGQEPWGTWAVGPQSNAFWVAMERKPNVLSVGAFPNCVPGKLQTVAIEVNGSPVATHEWDQDCKPWETSVPIPTKDLSLGKNTIVVRSGYAMSPAGDPRELSVGFTKLSVAAQ